MINDESVAKGMPSYPLLPLWRALLLHRLTHYPKTPSLEANSFPSSSFASLYTIDNRLTLVMHSSRITLVLKRLKSDLKAQSELNAGLSLVVFSPFFRFSCLFFGFPGFVSDYIKNNYHHFRFT